MAKPRIQIKTGKEYGWLTVIGEAPKDRTGHIRYHVRCRCGQELDVQTHVLQRGTAKCRQCANKFNVASEKANISGKTFEHWEVLQEVEKNQYGSRRFLCRCRSCGNISIKTKVQILSRKGGRCYKCPPEYHFCVKGELAIGILPNGEKFIIDTADISMVSKHWWHRKTDGYILEKSQHGKGISLHELLMNPQRIPGCVIDHINRNKLDCRRSNLRIVTYQQNSMNRSLGSSNKTGYVGAFFDSHMGCYRAKIVLNNRNITLGYSKILTECAQMYNIGAELLFREFAGHHNDVPEPSAELRQKVTERCLPFMAETDLATQECGLFSCKERMKVG